MQLITLIFKKTYAEGLSTLNFCLLSFDIAIYMTEQVRKKIVLHEEEFEKTPKKSIKRYLYE